MRNICFFSGDITRGGGTEKTSIMLANALVRQGKYRILFLSLVEHAQKPFFELHSDIKHYVLGKRWITPGPGYLRVIPRLRNFVIEHKIDVLIDIDIVLDVLSIPVAGKLGIKVISWEHFSYGYEMKSWYRRYILKYSVRHTDYIVTLTEEDRNMYMKKTGRTQNICAIYNPIQEVADCPNLQKEKWLVTVGHLIKRKGTDYLAKVALQVLNQCPDWKWMVVGSGEDYAYLKAFIKEHNLAGRLILTGRTKDVNSYLEKSQIYVMTSRSEGLPMVLLEAKACNLPTVSFDIRTGPREIIEDGVNGYLIPPFDCEKMAERLKQLICDEELRTEFAKHARNQMDKFRLENIVGRWNQIFKAVL